MRYYPICLDIRGRHCLVVGGGQVGTRKVTTLLACGAIVTVVSPQVTQDIAALADEGRITWQARTYQSEDMTSVFLVIGATDDEALNRRIHADAESDNRLCNIADQPGLCNFILPATVRQGDFMLAISTAGKSPAFAKHMRRQLQEQFGPEYGTMLDLMGAVRNRLLAQAHAPEAHKPLFNQLIDGGLLTLIGRNDRQQIDHLLSKVLGEGYTYHDLMAGKVGPVD